MGRIFIYGLIGLLTIGCWGQKTQMEKSESNVEFDQILVKELSKMVKTDQLAANNAFPPKKYSHLTQEKWEKLKDSIFQTNQKRAKEIFDKYGFVGFDLAGKTGSQDFWLLVQHSDHNPEFQKEVLTKMKVQVEKGNANPSNYGLLVDRVNLNTGQEQIYGTQVSYNTETGQAYPKKLADSTNVNQRRKSIGLEPIESYLNQMSIMHFQMNKDHYSKKGVTKPTLYEWKKKPADNKG